MHPYIQTSIHITLAQQQQQHCQRWHAFQPRESSHTHTHTHTHTHRHTHTHTHTHTPIDTFPLSFIVCRYDKFVTPDELCAALRDAGMHIDVVSGMRYSPLTRTWAKSESTAVNYIVAAVKPPGVPSE
jgi:hypothetical protein